MKIEKFILSILKTIENMNEGVIAYAYKTGNPHKTYVWWEVSVSDFDLYTKNEKFKKLTRVWSTTALERGQILVFVCGWVPTEEKLVKLSDENNLILNV